MDYDRIKTLQRAVDQTGRVVANLGPGQLALATPCTEWNARGLVNHLISSLYMFGRGAQGEQFDLEEFGVDRVRYDAAASYDQEAAKLKVALGREGALDRDWSLAYGEIPGWLAVDIAVIELVTHGWDLATATNSPVELDPELSEVALANARELISQFGRREGVFGPEVDVGEDADAHQRLAAYLGRQVDA